MTDFSDIFNAGGSITTANIDMVGGDKTTTTTITIEWKGLRDIVAETATTDAERVDIQSVIDTAIKAQAEKNTDQFVESIEGLITKLGTKAVKWLVSPFLS